MSLDLQLRLLDEPHHLQSVLREVFFDLFERQLEGAIMVNRDARVVWLNDRYATLLGLASPLDALGAPIETLIPHSRLREVLATGEPILLDVMDYRHQMFVVTRFPVKNAHNEVIGAIGILLYERWEPLKPLLAKFKLLQSELDQARRELGKQRRAVYGLDDIIGQSPACQQMKCLAQRAAQLDATVLLEGETGTGKELLAQAIHNTSSRADMPFVALNVAAIPDTLLEAELFGVSAGAYTGADRKGRDGKFKLADGGTLFLDEIGDLSPALQVKLLRVLQEQEIEPLGSNRLLRIDVRIIAATSHRLADRVTAGLFRADLFYRLNVLLIVLPRLCDRQTDLPALCQHLLQQITDRAGLATRSLTAGALACLARQRWPGNIRQLRNVLEQACLHSDRHRLDACDFDQLLPDPVAADTIAPLQETLAQAERQALQAALIACGGNRTEAAKRLGISRATFYEKWQRHGMLEAQQPGSTTWR
ncbi:transcriptional regulator with PAS, ATPase and Fis domain [Chitinivorax tropicus]|uniref:Transcriptional regulator with PAS, ATPase and Fis domain n=1 Tax=Chitinivorax tropicus TaxID=714531 RepID=A0A840MLF6_9PROT|nr:sigma 54-interacting transcriptional regulator [Chitinivorax tropicus]MBB5017013.1 transcriptional regulator with PAS, ATPase and Fis domain [Chitinivorax tropicus]